MTRPRDGLRRATPMLAVVGTLLIACQYVGQSSLPTGTSAPGSGTAASPTVSLAPTQRATPTATASMSALDAYDLQVHQQANRYLALWADAIGDASPGAIVFVGELTHGGGWRGPNADNVKTAFMSGLIEVVGTVPSEAPPPGEVTWPDGKTQTVALMSAAEALAHMKAPAAGDRCTGCKPVRVTGAKLVAGEANTASGPATVPLWQFEFVPEDEPRTPITHVAVADRVIPPPLPDWNPYGGNPVGDRIDAIYGSPTDTRLTAVFVGAPLRGDSWCGADYTGEAVESDLAVVVVIHGERRHRPAGPSPGACLGLGATRTAVVNLASPLGSRTVLEVQFGQPVVLRSGDPPQEEIRQP